MDANKQLVGHESCPTCGSRDNLARYADGHGYCFGCGHKEPPNSNKERSAPVTAHKEKPQALLDGKPVALTRRGISKETCEAVGYFAGLDEHGNQVQIANHFDDAGNIVAQKLRYPDKEFRIRGDKNKMHLYGIHCFKPGGRSLWVPEGEVDWLTLYEVTGGRQPVAALPNGAQNALKDCKKDLEFLESFDAVYLMFDNDEPGRKAQLEVAQLLSPGKARLVMLPEKDPNDCLKNGKVQEMLKAIEQARPYAPDGIVDKDELRAKILVPKLMSEVQYPWAGLNDITKGIRGGELVVITAGIGTGKTTFVTQVCHSLIKSESGKCGLMMMEDSLEDPILRMIGHTVGKAIHVERGDVTDEQVLTEYDALAPWFETYDYTNEPDAEAFLSKVNYMIAALGCRYIVIDNLSVIVAGLEERDERRTIDKMMKKLFNLAKRTGTTIFLVSHMKRVDGNKGHEDGVTTSMSHLRGSNSIGSNASCVIGLERDQQGENPNLVTVRVLKNRYAARTGVACKLDYSMETGSLTEVVQEKPTFPEDF